MTLGSFIMANKLGIAVVAAGGTVAAIGVVIYANVQDNRKSDRLHYDEQLNAIRNELSALCSEVSKLRAAMNAGVEVCAAEGLSDGNMRALAGTDRLTVNKGKGVMHAPSAQSLSSDGDFMDALDALEAGILMFTDEQLDEYYSYSRFLHTFIHYHHKMPPLSLKECTLVSFARVDDLLEKSNEQQNAYDELKKMYDSDDSLKVNTELLWRLARACHALANTVDQKNPTKKAILIEGREYATEAYKLDENNFNVLKWVAVLTGSLTDYLGTQAKIEQGHLFKKYLDKAIAMQPTERTLLHMRGRFAFSVANLSWLERKAAAAFFTAVPQATVDDALEDFLAAEELEPGSWLENLYYLVQCFLAKKDKESAVKYMKIAEQVIPKDDADRQMMSEIKTLLVKYS
uniref:Regulator of microtubule dynamics protein 1 n=2 Tax=Ascaris TaxID=6251 RepID=F1L5N9_ASCSU